MATATILHDVPRETFNYLLYPTQHPANQQYILSQLDDYSNVLLDTGKQYFSQARELYNKINDSEVARKAKAALRLAGGSIKPNIIMELNTFEDIRAAQPIMQRYIMAEPTIRQLYNDQRCDGYGDLYYNPFPGVIGKDHYDYRQVMSGIVQEIDDGESWKVSIFAEDLIEGDIPLTFENKIEIMHTWDIVRLAIQAGEDLSSIQGNRL